MTDCWLPEGNGVKWIKGVKHMVLNGNQAFGGEHTIVYTDIELQS